MVDKYLQILPVSTERLVIHNTFGMDLHLGDGKEVDGNNSFYVERGRTMMATKRVTTMMATKRQTVNTSLSLETFVNKLQLPHLVPMIELKKRSSGVKKIILKRKNPKRSSDKKVEALHQSMENINKRPGHFVCSRRSSSASDITSSSGAHTIQSDNEFSPGKISRCGSRRNVEERSHYIVYSPNRRVHQQFVFSGQKIWRSSPSYKSQTS